MNNSPYDLASTLSNFLSDVTDKLYSGQDNINQDYHHMLFDFLWDNRDDLILLSHQEGEAKRGVFSNLETISYILPNLTQNDTQTGTQVLVQHFLDLLKPKENTHNQWFDRLWPFEGSYQDHDPLKDNEELHLSQFITMKADLTLNLANVRGKIHPNNQNPFIN